jgi:hypothetical protein
MSRREDGPKLVVFSPIFGFGLRFCRSKSGSFWGVERANSFIFNTFFGSFRLNRIFFRFEPISSNRRADPEPCPHTVLPRFSYTN